MGREQEAERERQEGLRPDQGLDLGRDSGAQGSRREGLRRREEGHAPVQEGEGVLHPVSAKRWMMLGGEDGRSSGMWGSPASCLSDAHLSKESAIIESVYATS